MGWGIKHHQQLYHPLNWFVSWFSHVLAEWVIVIPILKAQNRSRKPVNPSTSVLQVSKSETWLKPGSSTFLIDATSSPGTGFMSAAAAANLLMFIVFILRYLYVFVAFSSSEATLLTWKWSRVILQSSAAQMTRTQHALPQIRADQQLKSIKMHQEQSSYTSWIGHG